MVEAVEGKRAEDQGYEKRWEKSRVWKSRDEEGLELRPICVSLRTLAFICRNKET